MTMTTRQRWVLALTSVAALMIALDGLVVTTALHSFSSTCTRRSASWNGP